jgi:hypothetical protein
MTKYTYENIKREFEKREFTLLESEYLGYTINHKYICKNGHETKITFKNLLKGRGCKKCAMELLHNKQRKSIDNIKELFEENGCILLSNEYENVHQILKYQCECGNIDYKDLVHFLRGQRCKECKSKKLREMNLKYDIESAKNIFTENGCILLEDEFITCDTPMKYICTCGRESKISLKSFIHGERCRECYLDRIRGENHWNWNANLTQEERENGRNIEGYTEWRQQVYQRDNYTCICCGDDNGGNLNAHHLDGYDWCKEKRITVNNGVTLCEDCHSDFHNQYGFGGNTKEQFDEWIKNKLI